MDCKIDGCIKSIFRTGLCSRHYEENRKRNAPNCKIEGCTSKSERAGMCSLHYRRQLRAKAPECTIQGCGRSQVSKGLCYTHWERQKKYGTLDVDHRARDRGARRRHPLYESWRWHSRCHTLCDDWQNDFWKMVESVGERPSPNHVLRRIDTSKPIGPGNWHWTLTFCSVDKAEYAREWRKRNVRAAKNSALKKQYGILIEDYERMLEEQNHVCAICGEQDIAGSASGNGSRWLAVDHCHKTGKIRGLLCGSCNFLVGKYEKNPTVLETLVEYMHKHNS